MPTDTTIEYPFTIVMGPQYHRNGTTGQPFVAAIVTNPFQDSASADQDFLVTSSYKLDAQGFAVPDRTMTRLVALVAGMPDITDTYRGDHVTPAVFAALWDEKLLWPNQ